MRFPKPKSLPGLFLYALSLATVFAVGRIVWVLVGQNVENLSSEKGYDKLLLRHWAEIVSWMTDNMLALVASAAFLVGGSICAWIYAILLDRFGAASSIADDDAPLEEISGKMFMNENVPLDGKRYINCKFKNVKFMYDGGPMAFERNEVDGFGIETESVPLKRFATMMFQMNMLKVPVLDRHGPVKQMNDWEKAQ